MLLQQHHEPCQVGKVFETQGPHLKIVVYYQQWEQIQVHNQMSKRESYYFW